MHTRKRLLWSLALTTVIALTAACGGEAEEPVEVAPATEEPAPVAEVAPVPEPLPEPAEPAEPQLEGEIVEIEDAHEMDWLTNASREVPATYYWIVRLRNDTTQTLDITVSFDFLHRDDESVVKTDRSTQRVSPAETVTFRVEGEMNREDSRSVGDYTYTWGWKIVESS